MSHLSLLFGSQVSSGMSGASAAGVEAFAPRTGPDARETACAAVVASRPDDYTLPSGVASMEHWLDLNA
ncbi:MAG TPA: hypothetical protein VH682_27885 [Gemmataceae bacterium]|jgi:hypothetical protein